MAVSFQCMTKLTTKKKINKKKRKKKKKKRKNQVLWKVVDLPKEPVIFGLIYKTALYSTVYQTENPDFLFKGGNPNLVVI